MKTEDQQLGQTLPSVKATVAIPRQVSILMVIGIALLLAGCGHQQIRASTEQNSKATEGSPDTIVLANNLRLVDIRTAGIAIITPSSITGQEEDKQALALVFAEVLQEMRPELHIVSLTETLSAINKMALTSEYKKMFEDYRLTGIFERKTLQKVAQVTGARYIAQLKLGAFRQESKSRWGLLGIRMMETKSSTIRIFLQIWDSNDGSIAWEGSQESTLSLDSFSEENISLRSLVEESARELIRHFPHEANP
ncbi:MAG: hypothetical protein WAO76_05875 [Georgfuchsia sp.]